MRFSLPRHWVAVALFLGILIVGWGVASLLPVMDFGTAKVYENTPLNVTQEGPRNVSGSEGLRRTVLIIEIVVVTGLVATWAYAHFTKRINIFKLLGTDLGLTVQLVIILVLLFFLYNLLNRYGDAIFLYRFWQAVVDDSVGVFTGGAAAADAPGEKGPRQWIAIAAIALVGVLLLWVATFITRRYGRWRKDLLPEPKGSRDRRIRAQIEETIIELEQGGDVDAVILRCYLGLSRLAAVHGIEEEETMTPREFRDLVLAGTEHGQEEVVGLVALFERARYGRIPLGEAERREALHHLYVLKERLGGP